MPAKKVEIFSSLTYYRKGMTMIEVVPVKNMEVMPNKKVIAILGAGSMGTAISFLISTEKNWQVRLWGRNPELISQIRETRENKKYLEGVKLPASVLVSTDLGEVINSSNLIVLAVPSFAVREMSERLLVFKGNLPPIIMISKGFEKETCLLPFQVLESVLGNQGLLHLTGVGYAHQIAEKYRVDEVIASREKDLLSQFKNLFQTRNIQIFTTDDLPGVQLGGALKNVMVIGMGMAECIEQKMETKDGLISVGVVEMKRLGKAMKAKEETFDGPAGRGDLVLSSCASSRNYKLGRDIYLKGIQKVERELTQKKKTVEGFHSAWAVYQLAEKYQVRLSMIEEVYKVIYEGKCPKVSAERLLELAKN